MRQNIRQNSREWSAHLWSRVRALFGGLDDRVTALEQGGGGGGGDVNVIEAVSFNGVNVPPDANKRVSMTEADPTVPNWAKAASKPTYTAQEVSAKAIQSPVADPTASGNDISFIDSITQDAQGVISPTKKTVPNASTTAAGLMSATDKAKLDGLDMLGFYIDNSGYICQRIGSDT